MTDPKSELKDPATMKYEEARDELTSIVTRLEEGTASLDQSLTLWERGEALAQRCNQWLDSAQARLDAVEQTETKPDDAKPDNAGSDHRQVPTGPTSHQPSERGRSADPPW